MQPDRLFRWAGAADHGLLADIMFDAVRNGDSLYDEHQRAAWVPAPRAGPDWAARLDAQDILVAEEGGRALGFVSLAPGGYVDFAYIRPGARHRGLFRQLMTRIVEHAIDRGDPLLWTHASLMAEPAFRALGFTVRKREQIAIGGQLLDRCEMERRLAPTGSRPEARD